MPHLRKLDVAVHVVSPPFSVPLAGRLGLGRDIGLGWAPSRSLAWHDVPRRTSSPPHTPHGSCRSRAPVRQAILAGHSRHLALAVSTSCGDSAKNRSGSSVHGSTDLVRVTGTTAMAATGEATRCGAAPGAPWPLPVPLTPGTDSVSSPIVPGATAVVAGQYMSIPSSRRSCGLSWRRLRGPRQILEAADPVRVRGLLGIEAGLPRPDPKPDANPSGRRHRRRYGPSPGTSCCCGPAVWRSSAGRAASAAAARRHHWRWRARGCQRADRYPARSQQATRHTADRQPGQEARCYSMWAPPPARRRLAHL